VQVRFLSPALRTPRLSAVFAAFWEWCRGGPRGAGHTRSARIAQGEEGIARLVRIMAPMCGRFALAITGHAIATALDAPPLLPAFVEALAAWQGRYNIAPSLSIPVVVGGAVGGAVDGDGPAREIIFATWGLIPSWSKDASIGSKLSNARADSVASKPAFRAAWKLRRCLVPATAYFEWQAPREDERTKQPYAIASADGELLTLGGLWERWRDPSTGAEVLTVAVITTDANESLSAIHHRMPVVVPAAMRTGWLRDAESAASLLGGAARAAEAPLRSWPVSTLVNSVRNDSPACVAPLAAQAAKPPTSEIPDGLW
jgi:putative SOS response-associated peptidase YedK